MPEKKIPPVLPVSHMQKGKTFGPLLQNSPLSTSTGPPRICMIAPRLSLSRQKICFILLAMGLAAVRTLLLRMAYSF
jgi:hypothetical protein